VLALWNEKISLYQSRCLSHHRKVLLDPLGEQTCYFPVAKLILFLQEELMIHSFERNSLLLKPFSSTRKDLLLVVIEPIPACAFLHGSSKVCIDFVSGS